MRNMQESDEKREWGVPSSECEPVNLLLLSYQPKQHKGGKY
jgi:hypothetical protein